MTTPLRYAAFTRSPEGGNPAGVVLDARGLDAAAMQAIAAEIGYSETAFLSQRADDGLDVRYFSPLAEVPFCGHATIASAVALAQREGVGVRQFHTRAGQVAVETRMGEHGIEASLTSVPPRVLPVDDATVDAALAALAWDRAELDPALPPRIAYAGARHLLLAAATRDRLTRLNYDFAALKLLMLAHDLTTLDLVWRESSTRFHVRNPFPVGGVVEDPATGAAAAALGAYLRELGLIEIPTTLTLLQGEDMGRPSRILVEVGAQPGIRVSGNAVEIP